MGLRALVPQAGGHNIYVVQPSTTWFWLFIAILRLLFDSSSYNGKTEVEERISTKKEKNKIEVAEVCGISQTSLPTFVKHHNIIEKQDIEIAEIV
jgi:hypothetical protein